MARTIDSAKRVINGTWGEVWLDGDKLCECYGLQLKVSKTKETVNLCGRFMSDTKATNGSGTGSLMLYHVDSGMLRRLQALKNGVDARCIVTSALKDPDSWGAERVSVSNVSFDDLTLADWQAATVGKVTAPFTFSDYELLDLIEAE